MCKSFAWPDLKQRPHDLFGLMALLLYLVSFIRSTRSSFDVNLHDTYFVIAHASLCALFSGILLFLWCINMLARRIIFSIKLSWVYVVCTLIPVVLFLILPFFSNGQEGLDGTPRRYYAFIDFERNRPAFNIYAVYAFAFVAFAIGQLILVVNIVMGLFKKKGRSSQNSK